MIKLTETKSPSSIKDLQLGKILKINPAQDDLHTWIRTVEDILTFKEAQEQFGFEDVSPDFTSQMIKNVLKSGEIVVYSSYPISTGVWVTPSKMEAKSYAGSNKIYSKLVKLEDVAWIDEIQGQYVGVVYD